MKDTYGTSPIFNEDTDANGNSYKNAYSNFRTNCVVSHNGKNQQFSGRPSLFLRKGKSVFGSELCFNFKIKELAKEYPANTSHDTIEFYLPADVGIEFLEDAIKHFKKEKDKKPEEWF